MTRRQTRNERDLTALLDGSLSPKRRAAVEERVARSPELRETLDRQRRVVTALRSVTKPAPATVQARIAAEHARSAQQTRRRFVLGGAAAAVAAAGALTLALALPSGVGGPTVVEAAALAELPHYAAAPRPLAGEPALLSRDVEGVDFPNWDPKLGWRATGARSDALDGREATTVGYANDKGARVSYTIVSGEAIDPPEGSRRAMRGGVELHSFRSDGRLAVTWLRDGRTCVLSGQGVTLDKLLELATWAGAGAVEF